MISLYIITNSVNRKIYVGITRNSVDDRLRSHFMSSRSGSNYSLHKAIRKYGEKAFYIELVKSFETWEDACAEEIRLISEKQTHISDGRGYNMTCGGEGFVGLSEESKMRIATAHRRENLKESTVQKMRSAKIGRVLSDETKQKMSSAHIGKKFSDEHKKKIGEANSIKNMSRETRQKLSTINSRKIDRYSLDGEFIDRFDSMKEASEKTGIHATNISGCCCGSRRSAGGYTWKYSM